jgi:hypothetical protein
MLCPFLQSGESQQRQFLKWITQRLFFKFFFMLVLPTFFKVFQFSTNQKHWMTAKLSRHYFERGPSNTSQNHNRYQEMAKADFCLWFCHWSAKNIDGIREVQTELLLVSCINKDLRQNS